MEFDPDLLHYLRGKANQIRQESIRMIARAGTGHPGGALWPRITVCPVLPNAVDPGYKTTPESSSPWITWLSVVCAVTIGAVIFIFGIVTISRRGFDLT